MSYYVIELFEGVYVKNCKYDTNKLSDAKKFENMKKLERFIRKNSIRAFRIKEIEE